MPSSQSLVAGPVASHARRLRVEPYACAASVGQASLWFLRQLMSCKTTYNLGVEFSLEGPLDAAALEAALREIVRRHDSLRTTFTLVDGVVCQVISDRADVDVRTVDLKDHADPEAEARRIADALGQEVLDLEHGPLFRPRILRLGPERHVLCIVVDHIVSDGVSLGTVWRELEVLYGMFQGGGPVQLAPPQKQFEECVAKQDAWLRSPEFVSVLDGSCRGAAGEPPLRSA